MPLTPEEISQMDQVSGLAAAPAAAPAISHDEIAQMDQVSGLPPTEPGFFQKVGTDLNKRLNNVAKIDGRAEMTDQNPLHTAAQIGGQGLGVLNDVAGEAISAITPDIVKKGIGAALNSDFITRNSKGFEAPVQYVADKVDQYAPEGSSARSDLDAAGNWVGAVANVTGAADLAKGVSTVGKAALDAAAPISNAASEGLAKGAINLGKAAVEKFTPADIPSASEIAANSSKAYKYADDVGGTIAPQARNQWLDKINQLHPASAEVPTDPKYQGVLDMLEARRDQPLSLKGAQDIDEHLTDMINGEFANNGKMSKLGHQLGDIQDELREYTRNPDPSHIIGGSEGFEAWRQGQRLWQKQAQMRDLEAVFRRAEFAKNQQSAIQQGFASLAKNPKKMAGYDPEIKSAIESAGKTGIIPDFLSSVVGSRLTGVIAGAVHGPIGAIAGEGTSAIARKIGSSAQFAKANKVAKLIGQNSKFYTPAELAQLPPAEASAYLNSIKGKK